MRRRVRRALEGLGPHLERLVEPYLAQLTDDQHAALRRVLTLQRKSWLRRHWPSWSAAEGRSPQIETALGLIARFQLGADFPLALGDLLDGLATEYRDAHRRRDPLSLARFLFQEQGLRGNREDYLNPMNSNLISVILSRKGIPISLALIYVLLGHRLGFDIEGCNVPRHFLARAIHNGRLVLVDCFDGGRLVEAERLLNSSAYRRQFQTLRAGASALHTVQRVLQNLNHAYRHTGDHDLSAFMIELLGVTARRGAS